MNTIKTLLEQLKDQIEQELSFCNKIDTPYVCSIIDTPNGKQKVVNQIIEYVGKNSMTIGEAINYIERETNPNQSN